MIELGPGESAGEWLRRTLGYTDNNDPAECVRILGLTQERIRDHMREYV